MKCEKHSQSRKNETLNNESNSIEIFLFYIQLKQ